MTRKVRRDADWGRRLKEVMAARGVEPGVLANWVRMTPQAVSRWRSGEMPSELSLERIASTLDTTVEWLQTGVGPRDVPPRPSGHMVSENASSYGNDSVPIARGKAMVQRAIAAATEGKRWVELSTVIQLLNELALEWAADRQSILAGPSAGETARIVNATQQAPGLPDADTGKAGSR